MTEKQVELPSNKFTLVGQTLLCRLPTLVEGEGVRAMVELKNNKRLSAGNLWLTSNSPDILGTCWEFTVELKQITAEEFNDYMGVKNVPELDGTDAV